MTQKIKIYKILNFCKDREHLLYNSQDFIHEIICKAMIAKRNKKKLRLSVKYIK